jgi:predicted acyl esterase
MFSFEMYKIPIAIFLLLVTQLLKAQHPLNMVREEVMIPMRDGVKLGAILYRPDQEGNLFIESLPKNSLTQGFLNTCADPWCVA